MSWRNHFMEILVLVVAIAVIAYFVLNNNTQKSTEPKVGENYACSGCGTQEKHNKRTVAAWGRGSRSFFCQPCHKKWRDEQQQKPTSSGCLGSLIIMLLVPIFLAYSVYLIV